IASARDNSDWDVWVSKVDLRLQYGMPCSKLEVSTVQHGTLSGAGYLHQSRLHMQRDRTSRQGSPAIARPPIRPKCNGKRRHQPCRSPNERRRRTRTTDEAYTEAPYKRSYGRS